MSDAAPFWEGCAQKELRLVRCGECGAHHHFAPRHCPACGSASVAWVRSSGEGSVESFTVVHRAPSKELGYKTPYVLALVRLEEGPRIMAHVHEEPARVSMGMRVRVSFVSGPAGRTMPAFVAA